MSICKFLNYVGQSCFITVVKTIAEMRVDGLQYQDIDLELKLPISAYKLMNGARAKCVLECM